MMNPTKYTALVALTISLSLVACGVPQTQPTVAPPTNTIQPAAPSNPDDYEHTLFHVQKYLDAVQTKKKLILTSGNITIPTVKNDGLFDPMGIGMGQGGSTAFVHF